MPDRQDLSRPAPELSEDGVPAVEELPESVLLTGDPVEGDMPPLDRPQAVKDWGTTAAEQLGPEPLDVRAAREVPDVGASAPAPGERREARQFFEPGADAGLADDEAEAIGDPDARLEDTLSPEEAAMSVVDEPAGLNYDADPGYIDASLDSEGVDASPDSEDVDASLDSEGVEQENS